MAGGRRSFARWHFIGGARSGGTIFSSKVPRSKNQREPALKIAREAERNRRRELEASAAGVVKRERPVLFKQAANEWLLQKAATSAKLTGDTYGYFVRSLIARFGDRLIVDIDHRDVAELQGLRLREGKSARTVNVEVGTLRQILSVHSHWTRIGERVKHLRERQDVGHALSREDEAKLLDAIRQSLRRHCCHCSFSRLIPVCDDPSCVR